MARRSRVSAGGYSTANRRLLTQLLTPRFILARHSYLPGDRRFHDPSGHFNAPSISGHRHHRLVVALPNVNRARRPDRVAAPTTYTPTRVAFADPKRVSVCVRRQRRKEVLFASGGASKGARKKSRRRNWTSEISC